MKMGRIRYYIFLFLIINIQAFCYGGTEIDSLLNLLNSTHKEEKITILNQLAYCYRLNEPDKTIRYATEALEIAEYLNNRRGIYISNSNLGLGHRYKGNYYEAMVFQQKALEAAQNLQSDPDIVQEFNRIGIIYKNLGLYNDALEYFLKAINILERIGDTTGQDIANLYNNIGNVYRKRGDLELALEYCFKTLKINQCLSDKEGYAYILNNIGNIYTDLEIYDQALDYQLQSLEVKKELGNKYGISTSMKNIGDIYLNIHQPDKSLEYYHQFQEIATEMNDKNGIASSMTDIGRAYIELKNFTMAEEYLTNALKIKTEIGDKIGIINAYVSLSNFYIQINKHLDALKYLDKAYILAKDENFLEDLRDIYLNYSIVYNKIMLYENALEYYQKYSSIKDSIFNTGISNKITQLQIKQKSEELEKEKALLEEKTKNQQLTLAQKNQFIYLLIVITLLVLITIIFIYSRYRQNRRANHELAKMNKSITGQNLFLQVLMDTIPNPMYYTDKNGIFVGCNKAFKEIHYLGSEEIAGKSMFHIYSKEAAQSHQKSDQEFLRQQGMLQYETKLELPDGHFHDIIFYKNTYADSTGDVAGLVGIMLDITDRKRAEDKIKLSEKQLRKANATKDKFFSIIAHDLKNPFNAILGFSSLLNSEYEKYGEDEKRTIIRNLYNVSESTSKLLQHLLEWAKTQTDNIEFNPESLDLKSLTNENLSIFSTVANRKNIRIISCINGKKNAYGDKNMVNTILRNLISNAIKFTKEGGLVEISSTAIENGTEICVADNGIGLKQEEIPKLFSISNQIQTPGTANEKGTGLGLILCKEFVEKNGGRIWAESNNGSGSKFYFTLPDLDTVA
jgi:PAS domain S-box-containing protein